jgi:hypothetical protein
MTIPFIARAGGGMPGDPPAAWAMPLIGDAIIGLSALWIAFLIMKRSGLWVWTTIIVWNAVAIWDALSAFVIHITNPWPDFFMMKLIGWPMFFAASAMHLAVIVLAVQANEGKNAAGGEYQRN